MKGDNISQRLLAFASAALRVASCLSKSPEGCHLAKQLIRAATAGGALYEEARGAESRPDFVHKIKVAGKEMRESHYWLRLAQHAQLARGVDLTQIIQEAHELVAILTASANTAKSRESPTPPTGNWAAKNKEPRMRMNPARPPRSIS
jgi:four helix bundle protein